jgi:hypothetical protein
MKRKLLLYGGLGALGVAVIGISMASAAGFGSGFGFGMGGMMGLGGSLTPAQMAANQQTEFQNEATVTGLPAQTIAAGWAQGQSLQQIAQANGVSTATLQANLKSFRREQVKDELAALVSSGAITQAQSDARLQFVQNPPASTSGKGIGMMGSRHGRGPKTSTSTATSSSQ